MNTYLLANNYQVPVSGG